MSAVTTNFHEAVITLQEKFANESTRHRVYKDTLTVRIIPIATAAITGTAGLLLTNLALTSMSCTFGLSISLLVPAAALFAVCFDSYKVMRMADIVIDRASINHPIAEAAQQVVDKGSRLPIWAQRVQKEINQTLFVHLITNQNAKH